jgi:hypothetical protein
VADFTGDGYADYADYDSNGVLSIHENLAGLNSLDKFPHTGVWYSTTVPSTDILVGEFTGDQFADYAIRTPASGGSYEIHENLGVKWVFSPWAHPVPLGFSPGLWNTFPTCTPSAAGDCRVLIGDFNGDKLADKADWDLATGNFSVHFNRGFDTTKNPPRGLGFDPAVNEAGHACVPTYQDDGSWAPPQQWCGIFGQDGSAVVNE